MNAYRLQTFKIANQLIGYPDSCFIIAEAGVNHNGDLNTARLLVDAAKEAGADAVKFQSFVAAKLATSKAPKADYQKKDGVPGESQLEMLQRLELSDEDHRELADYCREKKILFLSTPFDEASVDLLLSLDVAALKIGSGELTNEPLLRYAASKGLPVILSTGMATMDEVSEAVEWIRQAGCTDWALLHCVSSYPAPAASVNLRAMKTLADMFDVPVGLSDHTQGIEIAIGAAALGACILEKHLTLDRKASGPDHAASLEPLEFKAMVYAMRKVQSALGDGKKGPVEAEKNTAGVARRSLVAACDIAAQSILTEDMIVLRRPGTGLPFSALSSLTGKQVQRDIKAGELLAEDMWE